MHVAIADVAHYVRPGTRLDREAQMRGNSVYFPDRVVPMLPERISNDLCSLKEGEERPCLVVRMVFDRHGNKKSHTFLRAMMRSAAKLSYEEAQAAIDGQPERQGRAAAGARAQAAVGGLRGAGGRARPARAARPRPARAQDPDRRGRAGSSASSTPERLDAHRLIEEFMIQANVAAAETLEAKRAPVVYRVHDAPSKEKLLALRDFLDSLDLKLPGAGHAARRATSTACCSAPRRCPSPSSSTRWCCARSRRRSTPPRTSATSASTCSATPTSPRRSAATPT